MKVPTCIVCKEQHWPDRVPRFDGFGINACDKYSSRIASVSTAYINERSLLHKMAAASAMYEALQTVLFAIMADMSSNAGKVDVLALRYIVREAIEQAHGLKVEA